MQKFLVLRLCLLQWELGWEPKIALADGLDATFLAARDADRDGQRDLTIDEVYRRFDHIANAGIPDAQRWNIPDILRVESQTYAHPAIALRDIVTGTTTILTGWEYFIKV